MKEASSGSKLNPRGFPKSLKLHAAIIATKQELQEYVKSYNIRGSDSNSKVTLKTYIIEAQMVERIASLLANVAIEIGGCERTPCKGHPSVKKLTLAHKNAAIQGFSTSFVEPHDPSGYYARHGLRPVPIM